jgi:hypothetical protein
MGPRESFQYRRSLEDAEVPLEDVNWDNFAPVKVRVFFWVHRHGNTRTRSFLHRPGVLEIDHCPFCLGTPEDTDHLFFCCPRVSAFWEHVCPGSSPPRNVKELVVCVPLPRGQLRNTAVLLLLLLGVVRKSRNRMVFDSHDQDLSALAAAAVSHTQLWVVRAPCRLDCAPMDL